MREIELDLETFSSVNLPKAGVYKHCESEDFEALLFGYAVDGGTAHVVDLAQGEAIPADILKALTDDSVLEWAHNCAFERVCLSAYLRRNYPQYLRSYSVPEDSVGNYLDPAAWRRSMIWASYLGLPRSLKGVGAVLKPTEQKLEESADLVKYF